VPIHDPGYRTWQGHTTPAASRWLVVAEAGIQRAWRSSWLKRILLLAWLPGVSLGLLVFLYEQMQAQDDVSSKAIQGVVLNVLEVPQSAREQFQDFGGVLARRNLSPGEERHLFWSLLLLNLFRRSQPLLLLQVVGLIAPPLISQDIRSRAFLLYFSRPLAPLQYILGKCSVVLFYSLLITLAPALLLFVVGVLLSPGLDVLAATWDLPLRILGAAAVITVPGTLLALALSSLTTESRFAAAGWFAIWIFGWLLRQTAGLFSAAGPDSLVWNLSLFHVTTDVAGRVLDPNFLAPGFGFQVVLLGVLCAVSLAVLHRRVCAPLQV
jgi:ABC-2 type transport system permease protein